MWTHVVIPHSSIVISHLESGHSQLPTNDLALKTTKVIDIVTTVVRVTYSFHNGYESLAIQRVDGDISNHDKRTAKKSIQQWDMQR